MLQTSLLMGWSEKDLTPKKRVSLRGQFLERISESVETPICATSLAIEKENEQLVLCACDLVDIRPDLIEKVRASLSLRLPGFDPEKLIVSATHTHTSIDYAFKPDEARISLDVLQRYLPAADPQTQDVQAYLPAPDLMTAEEARDHVISVITESVAEAWQGRKPASCINAFGRAVVGHCRRVVYDDGSALMWGDTDLASFVELEGGNDSGIELLYIFDEKRQLSGVVANLACPAQTVQHRNFISSDFWGKARLLLRERFGGQIRLLALCSAAGDQCPVDLVRWVEPKSPLGDPNIIRSMPLKRRADQSMFDIEGSWQAGRRIANEIISVYETLELANTDDAGSFPGSFCGPFTHEVHWLELPIRQVTPAEYKRAHLELEGYIGKTGKKSFDYQDRALMHIHAGTVARYEYQQKCLLYPVEIHVIRLGDIAMATNPFELFLDYGNRIKARSFAQQTFIVQLACDSAGYLPTRKAEQGGHYSAYVSSGVIGHQGGDLLVRKTLNLINRLFS